MNNLNRNISSGICDNTMGTTILATKVFDNVRRDLDRVECKIITAELAGAITPLYASGMSSAIMQNTLTVTPRCATGCADVCGNLMLPGVLTYIDNGTRQTVPCNLEIPFCANMKMPEDSIWPFDITVHFSYFADNITQLDSTSFSCLVDGVTIVYVTACTPITIPNTQPIMYNSISQRAVQNQNTFLETAFYPNLSNSSL